MGEKQEYYLCAMQPPYRNILPNSGTLYFRLADSADDGDTKQPIGVDDLTLSAAGNVTDVGTTTPAEDFGKLLQQGFDLSVGMVDF